jgi:hypothetical protein
MKNEKISVFVLAVEVAVIICLHSVKGNVATPDPITPVVNSTASQPETNKVDNQLIIPLYTMYTIGY